MLSGEAPGQHRYRKGRGCQSCNPTGYAGRIGVYELLELDQSMMDALRRNDAEGLPGGTGARALPPWPDGARLCPRGSPRWTRCFGWPRTWGNA